MIDIDQIRSRILTMNLTVNPINESCIRDVYYKRLTTNLDGRGDLTELWSQPWSLKEPIAPEIKHVYFNTTHEGIIKAWHTHEFAKSQYACVLGKMHVVLVDAREDSSTQGVVNQFIIGTQNPSLIVIPPGVFKGWKSIKGDSVIVNLLDSADIQDNYKFPWDLILRDIWQPIFG